MNNQQEWKRICNAFVKRDAQHSARILSHAWDIPNPNAIHAVIEGLKAALLLMHEGYLIRDTSKDGDPGFKSRNAIPMTKLQNAKNALFDLYGVKREETIDANVNGLRAGTERGVTEGSENV